MKFRTLGRTGLQVSELCLGSMTWGSQNTMDEGHAQIDMALDAGVNFIDTAAMYPVAPVSLETAGGTETIIGNWLAARGRRDDLVIATKITGEGSAAVPNGENINPDRIRRDVDASLSRLQTDYIDLYQFHWPNRGGYAFRKDWRYNPTRQDTAAVRADMEACVDTLTKLVKEGKIRGIGLSEVSADTLRKAHAEHPIMAVQSEYSLWSRNPEIAVLDACKELGATFVAFSPVARAYLTGVLQDVSNFEAKDIRRGMPRFNEENYPKNLALLEQVKPLAESEGCSLAQLALAWVLQQGEHIVAIPGTTSIEHMKENGSAADVTLSDATLQALDEIFRPEAIAGDRYNPPTQAEIDTENFA